MTDSANRKCKAPFCSAPREEGSDYCWSCGSGSTRGYWTLAIIFFAIPFLAFLGGFFGSESESSKSIAVSAALGLVAVASFWSAWNASKFAPGPVIPRALIFGTIVGIVCLVIAIGRLF